MSQDLQWAVTWILNHAPLAKPKIFQVAPKPQFLLFIEGAVETSGASLGGVLCSDSGKILSYFGCQVPQRIVDAWAWTGTTHPVFQAKLLAVLASTHVWGTMLAHSLVTVLVDSEAVKHAQIKGSAHSESNQLLLRTFLVQEAVLEASFCSAGSVRSLAAATPLTLPAGTDSQLFWLMPVVKTWTWGCWNSWHSARLKCNAESALPECHGPCWQRPASRTCRPLWHNWTKPGWTARTCAPLRKIYRALLVLSVNIPSYMHALFTEHHVIRDMCAILAHCQKFLSPPSTP